MNSTIRVSSTWLVLLMFAPSAIRADDAKISSPSEATTSVPLSVAPLDHIEFPDDRPAWLSAEPILEGESHKIVVVSGPSDSVQESLDDLKLMQRAAVATYISQLVNSPGDFDFYPVSDEEIESQLVVRRYSGKLTQGDATKYEHAVELWFGKEKRDAITAAWKAVAVRDRLGALGVLAFGGFLLLVCSSGVVGILSRRVERREHADYGRPQNA